MGRARKNDLLLFFTVLKPVVRRDLPAGEALRRMVGEGGIPGEVLEGMARELDEGLSLSETMKNRPPIFPRPLPALVAAGEAAGDPAAAIDQCSEVARRRIRLQRHLQAALLYPAICLLMILGLAVVQALLDPLGGLNDLGMVAGGRSSQTVVASLLKSHAARLVLLGVTALVALGTWGLFLSRRRTSRKDRLVLNLPLVGRLYRLSAAAGFTRAMGALLRCGLPVDRAIENAIPAAANLWIQEEIQQRLTGIRDGEALTRALSLPGIFPPSLTWRLAIGEERGELPQAFTDAAAAYEEDLAVDAGRLARTVEPAAMIAVGIAAILAVWLWALPRENFLVGLLFLDLMG